MIYNIEKYFLLFFIYSFCGFIMEVICKLITDRKFVNRGFLIGPYCPIYGTGALLLTFILEPFKFNAILVFIFAILICGTLEYITSYVMEKLFKARWWDYSKYKFNINGRVCLRTIVPFGIFGTLVVYVSNPFLIGFIESINVNIINILAPSMFIIYLLDNVVSFNVILKFKQIATEIKVDSTEEITTKVKQAISDKKYKLQERLINAFPNFKPSLELIKRKKEEIINRASEFRENIELHIDRVGDNLSEHLEKINNVVEENFTNIKMNVKRKVGDKTDVRHDKKV